MKETDVNERNKEVTSSLNITERTDLQIAFELEKMIVTHIIIVLTGGIPL